MTCGTSSDGTDSEYNDFNIPMGHAYSLISAHQIKNTAGQVTNRLLRIRNPWGSDTSYNGKWGDSDTASWTAAAKAQVPYVNADDGVFFIEDTDFVNCFDSFTIAYLHDDWNNNIFEVLSDTAGAKRTFTFTLATAQEVYIGMEFYDSRMYAAGCKT